jgi:VanZ family protein
LTSGFLNKKITVTAALVLYMALIFTVSHLPVNEMGTGFRFNDKAAHLIEYSVLGFLFIRFFIIARGSTVRSSCSQTLIWGGFYAVTDEIHQGFVGYFDSGVFGGIRNPDIFDLFADMAGLGAACVIYLTFNTRILRNKIN